MKKNNGTVKRILNVLLNIVLYIFFAVCIFALVVSLAAKKNSSDALNVFGIQMRVVVSDSMAECSETDVSAYKIKDIPIRSMVFVDLVPEEPTERKAWYDSLAVGDVLTFKYVYTTQETVTHRITSITPKEGGYIIELEGDNKASNTALLKQTIDTTLEDSPNYVVGRVVGTSLILGLIITIFKTHVGIILTVILPCLIIMVIQIIRLVGVFGEKKAEEARKRERARDDEIAELKRQLESLQQKSDGGERAEDKEEKIK